MSIKIRIGEAGKGAITIGGNQPVAIQSMCNTKTHDWKTTVEQIHALEAEKCEIIRVAVPSFEAAQALPKIKEHINIPLVADIHFDHRLAIESIKNGADKIRINPGNIGSDEKVEEVVNAAKKAGIVIRIGINSGSLEKELLDKHGHPTPQALIESAENGIKFCEKLGFRDIVVSLKTTDVKDFIKAHRIFAKKCDYPLHIGVTEAGTLLPGVVRNSIGIGTLLQEGIGNTIRVSLTADPVQEVKTAKEILKALDMYHKEPIIKACPTCSRTEIDVEKLTNEVERRTAHIKKPVKIVVMGCVVNGPGESREADYGIAGGRKQGALYRKGEFVKVAPESELINELLNLIKQDL
jgi:(E)-4-hydroxy-3-methylbut-2-enyl-diphosphate synthase